jgi:hypothetical protein
MASVRAFKKIPDYTGSARAAQELAQKIQDYYHGQGHTEVRCWIEPEDLFRGDKKLWGVRSNIVFDTNSLNTNM